MTATAKEKIFGVWANPYLPSKMTRGIPAGKSRPFLFRPFVNQQHPQRRRPGLGYRHRQPSPASLKTPGSQSNRILVTNPAIMAAMAKTAPPIFRIRGTKPVPST